MYSPPYVNPSFARTCRHYECIGACGGGGRSAARSSRPSQLAAAQQRAEQLSLQQRLIRAALDRAAPLTAVRRDRDWAARHGDGAGRQDRLLLADARRAAELLRRQEQELEQEWLQERQRERRQERQWQSQEREWEREVAARRGGSRRRHATPAWNDEERYWY